MSASRPDFVVIGSGPNGLVAACTLARQGFGVLVLEAHATRFGGAVGSAELTRPGFVHDVGAAFFSFGKISPAFCELDLEQHGVVWRHGEFESAHPALDGTVAAIARDVEASARNFGSDEDGERWRRVQRWNVRVQPRLLRALLDPLPALGSWARLGPLDGPRAVSILASSPRGLATRWFRSEAARRVFPGLGLHVDAGPDDRFAAGIGYVLGSVAATNGYPVPEGGAGRVTEALLQILHEHGGRAELDRRVERVEVRAGRAHAVRTVGGAEFEAARGVLADTSAALLYLELLDARWVPSRIRRSMRRFTYGWGTFKVDWALSAPVPWRVDVARRSSVVHAGESVDDLARVVRELRAGLLPRDPYLVVGQQSLADPTRAPAGQHTLYAYSRVPHAAPQGWPAAREAFADRIDERIEALAPGFRASILERRATTPDDLESMNANLVAGDLGGGSNAWHRQLFFRPVFPYFRYRTPVRRLYLCSSYAHPGAGVHGMAGYNAARVAVRDGG